MLSSFRREGTTEYNCRTLECNWQEERSREEAGETVKLSLMEGSVVAPFDPDLSIAPPTRVPGAQSSGKLLIPDRMRRSRTTNDSSRQGADDGYREYTSMNQTFYTQPEDRNPTPISIEPNFHGTWGGPVQIDGRTKTRVGPFNRSKNVQYESALVPDGCARRPRRAPASHVPAGPCTDARPLSVCACIRCAFCPRSDATFAKKVINVETFGHTFAARPSKGSDIPGGFGSILPRHPETHSQRMLESTAMASWK